MQISRLYTAGLAVGLAISPIHVSAADSRANAKTKPAGEADSAAAPVSPGLKAFEKSLNDLGPQAKAAAEEDTGNPAALMTALLEKLKEVPTDKLPEDLRKAYTGFCAPLADMEALAKAMPADVPSAELKKWLDEKRKSDPEGAKHFMELFEKAQAGVKRNRTFAHRLDKVAASHGLNLRPFLDPNSIGREVLKPVKGKTTLETFAKDLAKAGAKRLELVAAHKEKGMKNMTDIAALARAQTALMFEIPVDGLPADLEEAFVAFRRECESYSWRVTDFPGDVPLTQEEIVKFIAERAKTDKTIAETIQKASARVKKSQQNRKEAGVELARAGRAHDLEIGNLLGEKLEGPGPAKSEPKTRVADPDKN